MTIKFHYGRNFESLIARYKLINHQDTYTMPNVTSELEAG